MSKFHANIFKREKASARASSDRFFFFFSLLLIKSLINSNYPKSISTHSEPPNHTSPKNSHRIPQRIPKEFPKISKRIHKKIPNQNRQPYNPKEITKNS